MHLKAKKRIKKFLKDKQVQFKDCKQVLNKNYILLNGDDLW